MLVRVSCARLGRSLAVCLAGALILLLGAPALAAAAFPGRNGELAYHGRSSEKGVLYVRRTDGTALRRLRVPGRPSDPRFSPLGRRIAFTSSGAIWVINADGSDARRVTPPGLHARNPAWSPDGSALAFAGGRAGRRVVSALASTAGTSVASPSRPLTSTIRRGPRAGRLSSSGTCAAATVTSSSSTRRSGARGV